MTTQLLGLNSKIYESLASSSHLELTTWNSAVRLSAPSRQLAPRGEILGCSRHPCLVGSGAEASKRGPADEVTLGVEGVVDRGVGGEETLG